MRLYCVCLFAGLLAVAFLQSGVMANNANVPEQCCWEFYKSRIPLAQIHFYLETRGDCDRPGVIFVMKKGWRICVNPKLRWVNKTMKRIDELKVQRHFSF